MNRWKPFYIQARQAAFLVKHIRLDIYLLEGDFGGVPLRLLVADDGSTLPYISNMVFPEGAKARKKSRISAVKAPDLIQSEADVVVVGANLLLSGQYIRNGFHMAPKWICPVLAICGNEPECLIEKLEKTVRSDVRRNFNRVRKSGFSREITTDPKWFDQFYHGMYKPYAENRHGKLIQMDSYSRVRKAFLQGGGVKVTQNGEMVAGAIFYLQGETMRNPYMGIKDGDESYVRAGASHALYMYALELAYERRCDAINFGSSRPFLSDGVLRHKMKWGMCPEADDLATAAFAIAFPRMTESARIFLAANPFFETVSGKLRLFRLDVPQVGSASADAV